MTVKDNPNAVERTSLRKNAGIVFVHLWRMCVQLWSMMQWSPAVGFPRLTLTRTPLLFLHLLYLVRLTTARKNASRSILDSSTPEAPGTRLHSAQCTLGAHAAEKAPLMVNPSRRVAITLNAFRALF